MKLQTWKRKKEKKLGIEALLSFKENNGNNFKENMPACLV